MESAAMNQKVLYHGSRVQGLVCLEPRRESNPVAEPDSPAAVYAGITAVYSATFAFPGGNSKGVDRGSFSTVVNGEVKEGPFTLTVPARLAHYLNTPASVYVVPADKFEVQPHITPVGWNYRSLTEVDVLDELKFPSIREAIEQLGGEVVIRQDS